MEILNEYNDTFELDNPAILASSHHYESNKGELFTIGKLEIITGHIPNLLSLPLVSIRIKGLPGKPEYHYGGKYHTL